MTRGKDALSGFAPREILLATAARVVLAALDEPVREGRLSASVAANLRLLEAALDPYRFDPPSPPASRANKAS